LRRRTEKKIEKTWRGESTNVWAGSREQGVKVFNASREVREPRSDLFTRSAPGGGSKKQKKKKRRGKKKQRQLHPPRHKKRGESDTHNGQDQLKKRL